MQLIDYTITVVYLVSMITIGLLLQKRASKGIDSYFLGSNRLPWWALGASGMASNLDVTGTMINTAFIFALGAAGFFIEIRGGVTLIMAFLMIFMGKWNRRAQVMTMAEWMHFRFGKTREGDVARLFSAISAIVVTIAMITYFAVGAGKFIGTFLGLPDIGRITNPLTSEEIVEMDQYLFTLDDIQRKIGDDLAAVQKLQSPGRAVEKSIEKLHTLWLPISENPGDLTAIEEFKYQIRICDTQFTAFYRALEKTSIAPDRPDLVANTRQIGKMLVAVEQHLTSTVSYDILISRSFLASTLMIILAMIYTVASGLYGVVWTDVFQGGLIFGTIIVVCYIAFTKQLPDVFNVSVPMKDGTFMAVETTRKAWTTVQPAWKLNMDAGSTYSIYNLFGIAILFYLIKVTIEGAGGTGGYMLQRFFAAKSDREAGLLSLFWTFLLSFRWPFIVAIASLGIYYGIENGVIGDPERVLPVVVNEMIPVGLKGFLVAGLMAAAMSTFDSTVNAGAAYWTKDIYQAYLKKNASEKQLMWQSRIVSIVIVLLGLFFSLAIKNINEIWGWITMSIGAGMIVPQLIRWYWWRLNGYGFAIGIGVGMISAVLQKLLLPDVPEYVAFSITAGASFLFMIAGTFLTAPTDEAVLRKFYLTTRPFGFWGPIRKSVPTDLMAQINKENRRDILSTFMAVPWQVCLFLMWMALMMKRWDQFWVLLVIVAVLSLGLYLNWYRHLSKEVTVNNETL